MLILQCYKTLNLLFFLVASDIRYLLRFQSVLSAIWIRSHFVDPCDSYDFAT